MTHQEIRQKFLEFFKSKRHTVVPSSSLLPTDPSVLFTTAGMQQFKPYYTGAADPMKDFGSLNTVSIQKSMRTSDIDEVGDESHLTFFEMLGNFSFGGYWKKEAIEYAHEFITKEMGLEIDYVSVFGGEGEVPADEESEKIWKSIDSSLEVKKFGRKDNFWGPTGNEGPCGPTTEVYVNGVEVWNLVLNQYYQDADNHLEPLKTKGIDTGMGLERLAAVVQGKENIFETDLFKLLIDFVPKELPERIRRIITDHSRSVTFLMSVGVEPSNKERGYVLRRLLRRVFAYMYIHTLRPDTLEELMKIIFEKYGDMYPELLENRNTTISTMWMEYEKFNKTVGRGMKELDALEKIDASSAFRLFESFGLPYEVTKEIGGSKADNLTREQFEEEFKKHQEISRAGAEKKFGGHGIIEGDLTAVDAEDMKKKTRLHTATHIIVAALEKVLNQKLPQAGSDITAERLRFDFKFPRKVTDEELRAAEKIANDIVDQDAPVSFEEMDVEKAFKSGAAGAFKHKYGNQVKVYSIGQLGNYFSRELCGGPHVTHTGEIGHITITKEESVSGGNRRIRATIS